MNRDPPSFAFPPPVTTSHTRSPAVLRRLMGECLQFPVRTAVALLSVASLALAQLYLTWLVKQWLDGPLAASDTAAVRTLLIRGTQVVAAAGAALFLSRYLVSSVDQTIVEQLRNRAVERLLGVGVGTARRFPSGDVLARLLNDAGIIASLLASTRRLIREALVASGALVILFVLEWRLALAACVLAPLTVGILVRMGQVIRRFGAAAQTEIGGLGAALNELLHGFGTVKGYQTERFELARFAARNAQLRRHVLRAELWSAALICVVFLLTTVGIVATLWYGTAMLSSGRLTSTTLIMFVLFAGQIVEPLRRLSELHGGLQTAAAAAGRVYEVIDLIEGEPAGGAPISQPVEGVVCFDRVTVAFGSDPPVLHHIDLRIQPRERVAIVGATGSGKTTLARLLVRFVDATSGTIRLDGQDLCGLRLADLRRAVTVVEQDPFLFSGPLVDNIRYGTWDAAPATVRRAVALAGLQPVIDSLPDGLDTRLGESGAPMSGGERQRVALARAIVRNPAVLVLDESTSALDSETEIEIFERLEPWLRERTVIAIAHRFSTVRRFPRAIMLHGGSVVDDGPVDALLSRCPVFVNLFADQLTVAKAGPSFDRPTVVR